MSNNYSNEQIAEKLKEIMVNDFEIEEDLITPDANLFKDLEFDSIDAVDLAVKLQQYTGKRIQPQDFKEIKTFGDVVDAVAELLK